MSATILYSDKVMKSVWGGGDHAPTEKIILAIAICKQHFSPHFKLCMFVQYLYQSWQTCGER